MMAGNQGHRLDWASTYPFFYQSVDHFIDAPDGFECAGDTVIGNDVWIGAEAMIMPGIKIGHGADIASRVLISRDVAPYSIVGGNPAKEIRKQMCWWNWPDDWLREVMPILCSGEIESLHEWWFASSQS